MIVIADDITGAAEIAGIAHSLGLGARLLCGSTASNSSVCCDSVAANGITVIATDTRSMTEAEAVAETLRIVKSPLGTSPFPKSTGAPPCGIFKKTDSALRGHVVAELTALMQATGCHRAIYLPANPTKGRIIRAGTYYINNIPIHQTDFSFDPEFPATTSSLCERFPGAASRGIIMPDAESEDDIRNVITQYNDGHTIFAGAADLFAALLNGESEDDSLIQRAVIREPSPGLPPDSALILCGSTQSKPLQLGIPVSPMPRAIYDGSDDLTLWDTSAYQDRHSLILTITHHHRTGKDIAVHLRTVMARMAQQLVSSHRPSHLIIEGGATAWATLQALGWTRFEITRQLAPGVVQMRTDDGVIVTLKPGSYPWNSMLTA